MAAAPSDKASSPSSPTYVGFFRLPIELRNRIYKEVLALPQQLVLFQDPGCPVESFAPEKPPQWLALLYTHPQIAKESMAILYSTNRFALEEGTKRQGNLLQSFLDCIGSVNASFLSQLRMDFPAIERKDGQSSEIRLREDGLRILRLLQEKCTNLKALETLVYGSNGGLIAHQETDPQLLRDVLQNIDAHFRAIGSLRRIVVRVCSGSPAPPTIDFMQQLGWIVLHGNR
ncbi:hypothetical protein KXX16_005472 [Aspergillus fumigatus]|nr:hypothetical protein CNMCM8714_004520 [Aspergillus fumigatus]KAH1335554.1 hypothetical protein KXX67_004202 [Aspergillus fumigatus]KAH1354025.1 hypothetical protein KXX33_008290 [Aspergillus fumigatus]KAH1438957.1 hypothetical protein KXX68_005737 [Aspergillus fumigatus]KAH1457406.1 hypothetical protein KXX53_005844 [Aspergillus fumigatus]